MLQQKELRNQDRFYESASYRQDWEHRQQSRDTVSGVLRIKFGRIINIDFFGWRFVLLAVDGEVEATVVEAHKAAYLTAGFLI